MFRDVLIRRLKRLAHPWRCSLELVEFNSSDGAGAVVKPELW